MTLEANDERFKFFSMTLFKSMRSRLLNDRVMYHRYGRLLLIGYFTESILLPVLLLRLLSNLLEVVY